MRLKEITASLGNEGGYFFFIVNMYPVAKIKIKMINAHCSIGNAPSQGQDLAAYRSGFTLQKYFIECFENCQWNIGKCAQIQKSVLK